MSELLNSLACPTLNHESIIGAQSSARGARVIRETWLATGGWCAILSLMPYLRVPGAGGSCAQPGLRTSEPDLGEADRRTWNVGGGQSRSDNGPEFTRWRMLERWTGFRLRLRGAQPPASANTPRKPNTGKSPAASARRHAPSPTF